MERDVVRPALVLSGDSIWRTPHLIQRLRRDNIRWDEFAVTLINDLALGYSEEQWIEQLIKEGNIRLATELAQNIGAESVLLEQLKKEEIDWQQMLELSRVEAEKYFKDQAAELADSDVEEYRTAEETARKYREEGAYGDAVATLEQALEGTKSLVERRRVAAASAFAKAEDVVSEARRSFATLNQTRLANSAVSYADAINLLRFADAALYKKDFATATEIAAWIGAICNGTLFPIEAVKAVLRSEPPSSFELHEQRDLEPELLLTDVEGSFDTPVFNHAWSRRDDEYLIDNYDVLSNIELMAVCSTTEAEIKQRIAYLGLKHERSPEKRVTWRNPYVAGRPIRGTRVFVGREDVFSFIEENLRYEENEDRNLIVLLGHRRTGKTSILLQLKQHRRELLAPRIPIYIDMEGLLPFRGGSKNLFWKLAQRIIEELQDVSGERIVEPVEDEFVDPALAFQQFLRYVKGIIGGQGLVLLLDEFQLIEPRRTTLDMDVYKMLRSIIQHNPEIDFILSGTMEMEHLMRSYQAALFGSAISKKIDFLDRDDARQLIIRPVQSRVTYSPEAVDLILEVTASHPYFVQLVCWTLMRYLIDRGKIKVSQHDVERVLPKALEQGLHFEEIWATETSDLQQYIMALVGEIAPHREQWCLLTELERMLKHRQQMPRNSDELDEAVRNLANRRILRLNGNGEAVRFQVEVFGQWVNTNKPFEVVKRDIRAEAATRRKRAERQPLSY